MAGWLAALLAALWLGGASAPEPRPPCERRALLLGDSNMYGALGHALTRELKQRGWRVWRIGKPGSGLARPDFWDWSEEGARLAGTTDPDLIVIMLGGNDVQRMRDGYGRYADGIAWEDEVPWRTAYRRRVRELADALSAPGSNAATRRVLLLSPTNRRPRWARERVLRILEDQREALEGHPRARFVNAYVASSGPDGRYLAQGPDGDGKRVPYRKHDGIHLTKAGGRALGAQLVPALLADDPCTSRRGVGSGL